MLVRASFLFLTLHGLKTELGINFSIFLSLHGVKSQVQHVTDWPDAPHVLQNTDMCSVSGRYGLCRDNMCVTHDAWFLLPAYEATWVYE